MHLPRQGYLPPDEDISTNNHMKPPKSSYEESIRDYMTSMHAPDKGYLPPKPKMKPPSSSYEKPISDYLASMHAPEQGYLPPKPSSTTAGFLPELASYLSPIQKYMASLLPPSKGDNYRPPSSEYLTPLKDHDGKLRSALHVWLEPRPGTKERDTQCQNFPFYLNCFM